jgi:hypothetical protein
MPQGTEPEVDSTVNGTGRAYGLTGAADLSAFLVRLTRFDPQALVRLRPAQAAGRTTLWGRLPWGVLVSRTVAGTVPGDVTVSAGELLAELRAGGHSLPARRDTDWRYPVPHAVGRVVETLPGDVLRRLAAAAAGTLRSAAAAGVQGRAVGQRLLRDTLLDHIAIVVTESAGAARIEIPQRLVQAVVRMGFLGRGRPNNGDRSGTESTGDYDVVHVRLAGDWVALSAPYGIAWLQNVKPLVVIPVRTRPIV